MSDTFNHEADAWDSLDSDAWWEDSGEDCFARSSITCLHCGETGLVWSWTPARWKLYKGMALHECPSAFAVVAAFAASPPEKTL